MITSLMLSGSYRRLRSMYSARFLPEVEWIATIATNSEGFRFRESPQGHWEADAPSMIASMQPSAPAAGEQLERAAAGGGRVVLARVAAWVAYRGHWTCLRDDDERVEPGRWNELVTSSRALVACHCLNGGVIGRVPSKPSMNWRRRRLAG